jgi:hypothetical protein
MTPEWVGPVCLMCNGTGKALWRPASGKTHLVVCPACAGHGRDAD